jgi:hypothetical protein
MSNTEANKSFKKFIQAHDSISEILQLFEDLKELSGFNNEDEPQQGFTKKETKSYSLQKNS